MKRKQEIDGEHGNKNVYLRYVYKTTNDYGGIICWKNIRMWLGRGSCGC
jgi:hypothetical protein